MSGICDGRIVIVTGAARGIGREHALAFAREGASVVVNDLGVARDGTGADQGPAQLLVDEIIAAGGQAVANTDDIADWEGARRLVHTAVDTFGGLDVLVNNAGILVHGTVDQYSIDDFDRMVAVNVRAVFVAVQEAARHLKPGGRVINIGSMVADRTGFPGVSVYGMTKAAVAALTRGLAIDLAPRGITVNNVQPGPTETDMNPKDGPHYDLVVNMLPVKRAGTADEIAGMVSYLASAEASFVTGASLTIDGGLTA